MSSLKGLAEPHPKAQALDPRKTQRQWSTDLRDLREDGLLKTKGLS
ncbi:MAG: hypothetical protein AAGB25_07245 [Pseudomonadota bacterium]